jgi:hypothetical protein
LPASLETSSSGATRPRPDRRRVAVTWLARLLTTAQRHNRTELDVRSGALELRADGRLVIRNGVFARE